MVSLSPGEKLIKVYNDCDFFKGSSVRSNHYNSQGCFVLSNKRLIGIRAKYEGIVNKTFLGFEKVEFQSFIKDISKYENFKEIEGAIKIRYKIRMIKNDNWDLMINFKDKNIAFDFT